MTQYKDQTPEDSNSNFLDSLFPSHLMVDEINQIKNDLSWQFHVMNLRKTLEGATKEDIIDLFMKMYEYQKAKEIVVNATIKSFASGDFG